MTHRPEARLLAAWALACLGGAWPASAQPPLLVEYVQVRRTNLTFDAALTGTIAAKDSVDIGFRLGGRVTEVLVREGDRVAEGQPLARTDPLQQEQALQVARAAVVAAEASEAQARQALERADAMLRRGVGTRAAFDAASQGLSAATGALTQARATLGQAERALEDTVIRAPSDAIVTARQAEPGQIVGAAQAVISLASATGREAVFLTPDTPLLRDAIGAPVSLNGIDFPELRMQARVTEIAPLVDPATGSVTVRAEIEDAPVSTSLLGAAVRGAVHFPAGTGIAVPWTALTAAGGQPAVWLVDAEHRARLAPVRIERFINGTVILAEGVEPGQIVVGAGSQMLYPGRQVAAGPAGGK
ncbi:efflux RND transporter periplasmic adaptor subunit [Paracoccus aminovorans]|uniref:efflux RND transporter periplasmic adaptor subunit n=1 Tax=Paracoccus aminovorans TaxID=34004 RepID=UPI000785C654|nr:efflux RND transporter periplasmic adaptor subunit [Paracoccus aminovorans]MDQ7776237.1 efflux RND transporter periplasmic adaptor subunit [Paracoccus aminovorans]